MTWSSFWTVCKAVSHHYLIHVCDSPVSQGEGMLPGGDCASTMSSRAEQTWPPALAGRGGARAPPVAGLVPMQPPLGTRWAGGPSSPLQSSLRAMPSGDAHCKHLGRCGECSRSSPRESVPKDVCGHIEIYWLLRLWLGEPKICRAARELESWGRVQLSAQLSAGRIPSTL